MIGIYSHRMHDAYDTKYVELTRPCQCGKRHRMDVDPKDGDCVYVDIQNAMFGITGVDDKYWQDFRKCMTTPRS